MDGRGAKEIAVATAGDVRLMYPGAADDSVRHLLSQADVALANLETPLTARGAASDKLSASRADPSLADDLRSFGFQVVSLANNHVCDYGTEGLADTIAALGQAGVCHCGAGRNYKEAACPAVINVGGSVLSFLSFAATLPAGSAAGPDRPGVAPIRVTTCYEVDPHFEMEQPGTAPFVRTYVRGRDLAGPLDAVASARVHSSIVIVSVHWGIPPHWQAPFQGHLATYQQPLGHALVDAGADAVVGHHPHVLHGIEVYKGRPIMYSLGNFVWHRRPFQETMGGEPGYVVHWRSALKVSAEDRRKLYSMVAVLHFSAGGTPVAVNLVPIVLSAEGNPSLADAEAGTAILKEVRQMSLPFGTEIEIRGGRGQVVLTPDNPSEVGIGGGKP